MRGSGMQCSGFNMGEWLVSTGREGREERKQLGWRRQGRPHTKHGRVVKSDTAVPFLPMPPLMPMLRVHYVVLHVHFWLVVKVACPPGINYFRTQNLGFRRLILSSSCITYVVLEAYKFRIFGFTCVCVYNVRYLIERVRNQHPCVVHTAVSFS